MKNTSHSHGRGNFIILLIICTLLQNCKSQESEELNIIDDVPDDIFLKDESFSDSPSPTMLDFPSSPPSFPTWTIAPKESPTNISFEGQEGCRIWRDIYCVKTTQEIVDNRSRMNSSEVEEDVTQHLVVDHGVSYQPLVSASVDYWSDDTINKEANPWIGYTATAKENNDKFKVRALAVGVIITSISNIDSIKGIFEASLKLRFYEITEGPFKTISEAVDTIYKEDSKTTLEDSTYYKHHKDDFPGAWQGEEVKYNEVVHPDGICTAKAMSTMKPILADDFNLDLIRLPHLRERFSLPRKVTDAAGYLRYVDMVGAEFKFKPINRKFYPVQTDLLDIIFDMGSIDLVDENQQVEEYLLCLHPAYSGLSNHVFGSDAEAGTETSDSMTMIPYLTFDRVDPWYSEDEQYYYGPERQKARYGNGSGLQRKLGLRVIVEHPLSKGWYRILPYLFVSFAAVANFISADPQTVSGTTMIQALLGVNSLVTQSSTYIGLNSVLGDCVVLAYVINGLWISTVVFMMLINQAKRNDHGEHSKWYSIHQKKMFRYLRLLAISLCLLYIPFICAYTIDKSNGKQTSKRWVWGLVITIIVILFVIRVVKDYRIVKVRQNESKESSMKALVFSSKPLILWSQAEVISWINIGAMHEESYFSDATRYRIAAKLKDACIYGKLLSELASDAEKLVQFVGLSYGDAVMLLEEVAFLSRESTKQHRLEVGTPPPSPSRQSGSTALNGRVHAEHVSILLAGSSGT